MDDRVGAAPSAGAQPSSDDGPNVVVLGAEGIGELGGSDVKLRRYRSVLIAGAIVAFVAVAAVALFAGSDDNRNQMVKTVDLAAAVEASQVSTARAEVTQEYEGGREDRFEGELNFENRSAHLRGDLAMTEPDGADLDPDDFPEELSHMLNVMQTADELIFIGDKIYLRSAGTWWDLGPGTETSGEGLDVFSPATVLDQVAKLGQVRTVGSDDVRGAPATHYTTTNRTSHDRYDVWINSDGLVVRIIETDGNPKPGTPTKTTTDLFDFGAPVTIEAPADPQALGAVPGAGTGVVGDLHDVASGTEGDVSWTLWTGQMADGRRCVQVDTNPALDGEVVILSTDGTTSTSVEVPAGSPTGPSCGPESINGSGAMLLTVGGKNGDVHYLAGLLDKGAEVTITFPDGREQQLEAHEGVFLLTFSGDDWPTLMSGGNATCELQGDDTMSGTDSVC